MTIDQKAIAAAAQELRKGIYQIADSDPYEDAVARIVTAYIAALPASDHAGLVERLEREARAFDTDNGSDPEADAGTAKILREAATALSAKASPAPLEGVRVKPLEWKQNGATSLWTGELAFGAYYTAYDEGNGWRCVRGQFLSEAGDDEIAFGAKPFVLAAAQSDYEARILSAIVGSAK